MAASVLAPNPAHPPFAPCAARRSGLGARGGSQVRL